ncbi:peptidoglycan-binding protein [Ochrobactrum sp. Kaboul]|nr:peptidoglycan-binding protein [Ochrobactrum sp. Kaboul]
MANPELASGSRSRIDDLNAHRERRPTSAAMQELDRTLAGLERRLMELEQDAPEAPHPNAPSFAAHQPAAPRYADDTAAGLAEIADNLRRRRDSQRQLQEQAQPRFASSSEISDASREMSRMQRVASEEGFSQRMSDDFDRLSESVHLLAERSSEANAQALRRQFDELNRTVHTLAREETLRRLDNRWDRFDEQMQAFEKRHDAVNPALNAIGSRLEQMREAIGTLPQSHAFSAIEERIGRLTHSIEDALNPQNAAPFEQDMLNQIDTRLDEISRAIIATSRAQRPDQEDARRLERIEKRLAELADQIDGSASRQNSDVLFQKLSELSQRIDVLSSGQALPDRIAEQLAHQISLLANQVAKVTENLSQSDYRSVEARLEAIGQKLENAERRSQEPDPAVLDTIDRRFAELTERLDAQYGNRSIDSDAIHTLEGRLDDISQQISLGLLQAPQYEMPNLADNEAIRNLEDQIANIAHHLAQPVAELAQIKPRLDSIERSIATNRETVLDAAREAAESAVARVLQHGNQGDTAIARQLADDMKSLEMLARNTDERNSKTFEAVHDTLVKIVDRLSRLEQDMGSQSVNADSFGNRSLDKREDDARPAMALAEEPAPRFAAPETNAPRLNTSRSPATAAAEAAFATIQGETAVVTAPTGEASAKSSLFGGLAKAMRGRRAEKNDVNTDNDLKAESFDKNDAPAFESEMAAVEPIVENEPDARFGGDHMPDLNSIMKRVREERRQREDAADAALAANGKVDFITAARRAAQLAAAESEQLQKGSTKGAGKKKKSVGDIMQRQRKPILMAIGAVMIAMAGLQVGSAFLTRDEPTDATVDLAPQPETPAAETPAITQAPVQAEAPAQAETPQVTEPRQEKAEAPAASDPSPTIETVIASAPTTPVEVSAPEQAASPSAPAQVAIPAIPEEAGPAALREAAAKGDARALFEIGNRYMEGRGVTADFNKAAQWYDISAGQGFAPAQYRLGNFNEKGLGMPRDLDKAKTWYQLSAQQGNASAMHNLAVLFATGANGAPDNASAARWFTEAADLGVKDSQFNLGILAAKGLGIPVNLEESYKWFALAANSGDKDAAQKRDQIAEALKPEQLEQAKATVQSWKPKPLNEATNSIDVPDAWTETKPTTTGSVDMKKAVRNIQLILQKNGYDVGTADGVMGGKTRTAIASFQKANGLQPTGNVDQKLVQLLLQKNT